MKRASTCLSFSIMFAFGIVLNANAQVEAKWLNCGSRSVQAEKTAFSMYKVDVYKGKTDQLLVVTDSGSLSARFCLLIVGNWKYVGFKQFPESNGSQKKVTVFTITNDNVQRYFNIDNGNEVLIDQDDKGKNYVSSQTKAAERIFF